MNRLRSLAGIALVIGLIAGLTSCVNHKGDLGADLDQPAPTVVQKPKAKSLPDPAAPDSLPAETVEVGQGEAVDLKSARPISVADNRLPKVAPLAPKADP